MRKKIEMVLERIRACGAEYGDIRIIDTIKESITTEDQMVADIIDSRSKGVGIRVILDGSLGFAATQDLSNLAETVERAIQIAQAGRMLQKEKIVLSAKEAVRDEYQTPIEIDPFTISKEDKINLLLRAEKAMREAAKLSRTTGSMVFQRQDKIYADTEGSYIVQRLYESGAGIEAVVNSETDSQIRSYPNSSGGNHATAGYEFVESLKLVENAPRIAIEAERLINAEQCPSGHYDLIIDSSQMALQIHESIGHATELDRIFGSEAAYAGMSFLLPGTINDNFKYGSEFVTVVADATIPKGLGSFGYDDDGVKAQKTVLIDKGMLKNYQTSRDTASKIGQLSNGTNRADGWSNIPIVRMTNINLLPGSFELDELIKGIDDGFYLCTNKSWSIDDKRLNFQFSCEIAHEIKNGKLTGKIYKNPIYTGITPKFWGSCDGVGNEKHWILYGVPNCGKGQPGQVAHVGHGSAPARFRNVKVGVEDVK